MDHGERILNFWFPHRSFLYATERTLALGSKWCTYCLFYSAIFLAAPLWDHDADSAEPAPAADADEERADAAAAAAAKRVAAADGAAPWWPANKGRRVGSSPSPRGGLDEEAKDKGDSDDDGDAAPGFLANFRWKLALGPEP